MQAKTIENLSSSNCKYVSGPLDSEIFQVLPPESCEANCLVFISELKQLELARSRKATCFVVSKKVMATYENFETIFETNHIQLAMTQILPLFDTKALRFAGFDMIHPTAVISPSAEILSGTVIGPFAVIGDQVKIGSGVRIGSHTVIERQAQVGDHCTLHPHVFIGANCVVGHRCEIHPHTTIGSDGYGYATDANGHHHKIPQLGNVVLEDDVEIGSSCAIDRGTLTATRIRRGTKLDNLVHIAHNCDIGPDNFLTAGFMMAGSSKTGRLFATGGNTVVADHITITDNVVLSGRTTVTKDITEPGQYGGHPVQPMKDYLRTLSGLTQINEMRKSLSRVAKHLGLDESK